MSYYTEIFTIFNKLYPLDNTNTIYPTFKTYTKTINDIEKVLGDMLRYASAYQDIITFNLRDNDTNEITKRLDLLDMTVTYPFLMAFCLHPKKEDTDK